MPILQDIFRSYDIRGKLDQVTEEVASKVAAALVVREGAKTIVVGRDMRQTSPALAQAAVDAIIRAGGDVIDIGMCTTSLFNYAVTKQPGVDVGMMITASHNPADYNGIKVGRANSQPISGKELFGMLEPAVAPAEVPGNVSARDLVPEYIDHALSHGVVPDLRGAKIVIDYGNGMGIVTVRPLMERLGAEPLELYPEPDAHFPNHEANPAIEETLVDLKAKVKEVGADLGIALDGDVDRVKFIDENGESVQSDHLLALLASDPETRGQKVVLAMNLSWATHEAVREAGGEVIECPIGRTNIIATMIREGALLGGEFSGHFMYRDFSNLESVDYTIARVLSAWKKSGKTFSQLVAPYRRYANTGEINLHVEDKQAALHIVEETFASQATDTDRRDGIRCRFADWWFILRPSNTEPLVRLTVEAKSRELLEEKRDEILRLIQSEK
jgi:phosphomannomutase